MNRLDMEAKDFHTKVRNAYLELANEDKSGRWKIIDASQTIAEVEASIWKIVSDKIGSN